MELLGSSSSKSVITDAKSLEFDETQKSHKLARLKRLKIQEKILINSVNKSIRKERDNEHPMNSVNMIKEGMGKKNEYIEIRNLFQHVRETSRSQDILSEADISYIKKDVLLLENKINKIKESLQNEMMELKVCEKLITEEITKTHLADWKKNTKVKIKSYSDVVASPVKVMITSPLKCAETQDFHDFIATQGRYGRWIEYNHNIFVHTWQKYFRSYEENSDSMQSDQFEVFLKDVMSKITGITKEEVVEHCDWYSKYLQLKYLQQEAIDRWKENKSAIKASQRQSRESAVNQRQKLVLPKQKKKLCQEQIESNENFKPKDSKVSEAELIDRLTRPTGQWYNRVYGAFDVPDTFGIVCDPDTIKSVRVPEWRAYLQERD